MQHLVEVDGEVVLFLNDEFKVVFNVQILLELGIKVAMQVFDPLDDLDDNLAETVRNFVNFGDIFHCGPG